MVVEAHEQLDIRRKLVSEGVDILLTMTKDLGRQKMAFNQDQIMYWFERSKYVDCRINAFPAFLSKAEEYDYQNGINLDFFTPQYTAINRIGHLQTFQLSVHFHFRVVPDSCFNAFFDIHMR